MSLIKIATVDEYTFNAPPMELMPVSSKGLDQGWLEKRGSVLSEHAAQLEQVDGHTPFYAIPMGAYELFGQNRNADVWVSQAGDRRIHKPAGVQNPTVHITAGLKEKHPTFVSDAHCFKAHNNTDPKKASGFIKYSAYNDRMGRVELIGYADTNKWEDEIHKMASGDLAPLSMAASVDGDYCSYCGHKANTIAEHCSHVKFHKNAILDDGHQVGMINDNPTFIDLSSVGVNADRLGYGLGLLSRNEKEATLSMDRLESAGELAELAEKLAKIEKKVERGIGNENLHRLAQGLPMEEELPESAVLIIRSYPPKTAFKEMAKQEIMLSPRQFFQLTGGDAFKKVEPLLEKVKEFLPSIFQILKEKNDGVSITDRGADLCSFTPLNLQGVLEPLKPKMSMDPEHVSLRVTVVKPDRDLRKPSKKDTKESSFPQAAKLAREYGKYQLQFLRDAPQDLSTSVVVSNFVQ